MHDKQTKEVPFTIYRYDERLERNKKVYSNTDKSIDCKKSHFFRNMYLTAGAILLIGTYVYLESPNKINKETGKAQTEQVTDGKIVAEVQFDGQTYNLTKNDSFMKSLISKRNYANINNLSVDKDSLNQSIAFTDPLSIEQLMRTGFSRPIVKGKLLNAGMYDLYTAFDGKNIDFEKALKQMGIAKVVKMGGKFSELVNDEMNEYNQKSTKKSNLEEFKASLDENLNMMLNSFDKEKFYEKHNHPEEKRFFDNYFKHLNEKIMLSYCVTELLPRSINPAVNIEFLDKLLQEAGPEFIYKIPAMHDKYLSHGAFQLTSQIITPDGAPSLNVYLPDKLKIPSSMKYYDVPEEHNRAAVLTAIYNAEILVKKLRNENQLTKFNNNFEKLSDREQEIFLAGQICAAHHASTAAAGNVVRYQKKHNNLSKIIQECYKGSDLEGYYNQSVRNYLVLEEMGSMQTEKSEKRKGLSSFLFK